MRKKMREVEYKRMVDIRRIPTCNIMGVDSAAINMECLLNYLEKILGIKQNIHSLLGHRGAENTYKCPSCCNETRF